MQSAQEHDRTAGAPWREPVRGGHPGPSVAARPGMELLRAVLSGEAPQPPLSRLIGLALAKADDGTTTFTLPLTDWLCDPDGSISLGPPMIVADAPMARAAIT